MAILPRWSSLCYVICFHWKYVLVRKCWKRTIIYWKILTSTLDSLNNWLNSWNVKRRRNCQVCVRTQSNVSFICQGLGQCAIQKEHSVFSPRIKLWIFGRPHSLAGKPSPRRSFCFVIVLIDVIMFINSLTFLRTVVVGTFLVSCMCWNLENRWRELFHKYNGPFPSLSDYPIFKM